MLLVSLVLTCGAWVGVLPLAQEPEPADVRAAVERFFAMQEAEDLDGYLALWSRDAQRPPTPAALKTIFDNGSDRFTEIIILKVTPSAARVRARVSVTRHRTDTRTLTPEGIPRTFTTRFTTSLTFVREEGALKLLSEGPPAEDLATALIAADTAAEREALLAAEPDLVTPLLTAALARRGDTFAQAMKFQEAERIYERALEIARRVGDPKAEGQALQNLGNSQYFRRDLAAALQSYEQRLAVERQAAHDEGIAAALLGIATVRYSTFEYSAALAAYREALALYERLEDEIGIATTLVSTGNVLYLQGDYDGAIADYRRSRALHRKTFNFGGEARALEGLGRTLAAQGDLAGALEAYSGVLQEAIARKVRPMQATATQSIGDIHFRLGNLDAARAAFDESRNHFEAVKDLEGVGRIWQALALTDLVANRFAAAEKEYGESMSACTAAGEPECVARAIVGLGFAQASQERFNEAIASYGKGIAAFTKLGRLVEAARGEIGLSQALFGKGDYTAALAAAGRARDAGAGQQNDDVLWRAHVAAARAWRRLESPGKASAAAAEAIASIHRLWDAARHQPSDRMPSDSTSAFAIRAVLQAESGDALAAFTTLEELRAHALRMSLATVEREIARGMTPEERANERAAAVEVVSLHVQLEQERNLPRPDAARMARLQERIGPAVARRAELERTLYQRLPALRTWRGLGPVASAADIAALAGDGEALASFVLDEHDLLLITLTTGDEDVPDVRASVVPVKRQKVAELIAAATAPAVMRDMAEWRRAASDLVNLLPPDALERLASAARVLVVPDDVLWRVPFEALPHKSGFLGDRTRFAYAGSFSALAIPPEPRDERALAPIVAAAAPTLATAVRDRVQATAPGWVLRPADAAEREAALVLAAFEPDAAAAGRISGDTATEAAFRAQAPAASWLHVGVPFRMNGASPVFSPMLWAAGTSAETGTPAPEDDGMLQAREIMNLDLRARAVVFSDPAAASMRDGAAAAPVVWWAWRAAGVPVLMLPRWALDAGQDEWLSEFYKRIKAGERADLALEGARAILRSRDGTRAPHAWAAWMMIGR